MTKRFKNLLALGVVTIVTASSMVPVSALSKDNCKTYKYKGVVYLNINGKEYNFGLDSNCNLNKPSIPEKPSTPETDSPSVPEKPSTPETDIPSVPEKPSTPETEKPSVPEKPSTPETGNFSEYQREVLDLVNAERSKRGLKPVTLNGELSNVATIKSQDMINKNYFDHNSPTYGSPFDMMKQFGISYKAAGENIAMGQKNPKEVMTAWMNSDGHRKNILSSDFNELGVGIAKASNGSIYWTQMFIGK